MSEKQETSTLSPLVSALLAKELAHREHVSSNIPQCYELLEWQLSNLQNWTGYTPEQLIESAKHALTLTPNMHEVREMIDAIHRFYERLRIGETEQSSMHMSHGKFF